MNEKYEKVALLLKKYQQEQLLIWYHKLSKENQDKLLDQILSIDFDRINSLYEETKKTIDMGNDIIEPINYVDKSKLTKEEYERYETIGGKKIRDGKLAVVTMAGGQGTRLGHNGPKGTFDLGLESHRSIFEIFIKYLTEAKEKYDVYIPWYIMTSHANHQDTISFFENNNYFSYPKEKITFFMQGELPMVGTDGKILVNESGLINLAADGHGGVFEAIVNSGSLEDMKKKEIEWVFVGGVDNVLVKMIDSVLIGLSEDKQCTAAGKSVVKANPEERVGVFCSRNGKPSVIEYTEIAEEMAKKTDKKGELMYGESHILCNMFHIQRIESIAKNKLPYHSAFKKANYINSEGKLIKAEKPNAYKFESFIFDAFSGLDSMAIMRVKREDEFAPVKNASGVDSPETARQLYINFHKKQ